MAKDGENDHKMDGTGPNEAEDLLHGFSALKFSDIRRDAWVIYKDGSDPIGLTRGQWMDKYGVGPTMKQFTDNSYAIHASLTNNDKLKINGQFGEHDYMPPQVFVNNIGLSESQQRIVDSTKGEKEQRSKAFGFKRQEFNRIAAEIGIPDIIPRYGEKLLGNKQVYETVGGGPQVCTQQYPDPIRAGNNIPNIQIWKGTELLEVAWHTKGGKGKYDLEFVAAAEAKARAEHGDDVKMALKASTNRTMGTNQLNHYQDGAENRWRAQLGGTRERTSNFSHLTVVVGDSNASNIDFKWLKENAPSHDIVQGLLAGKYGQYLRMISRGVGRTSVPFAMKQFGDVAGNLLDEAGIPRSIAEGTDSSYYHSQQIGKKLPAISFGHSPHRDGPLKEGQDIKTFLPEQMMIAGRDRNGERTGMQKPLSEYQRLKLRLPDDAAEQLGFAPDIYSKTAEKTSERTFDNRSADRGASRAAGW